MLADDAIYTSHSLHTVPHRIRVRQVIGELRGLNLEDFSYADVGCGGGTITRRIVEAIQPMRTVGYDANPELIQAAAKVFPDICFRVWNLTGVRPPEEKEEKYDLVTCLETLEHIEDYESALGNLLRITARVLLITVPIELGLLGTAKFAAKAMLGRKPLGGEHRGTSWEYFNTALASGDISRFRVRSTDGFFVSHAGFDYRKIDSFLRRSGIKFPARNRGWNRFYRFTVPTATEI
jgi:SAM-dependent methyltransferase